MNLRVFLLVATLSPLFLSACGSPNPGTGLASLPAADRMAPSANDVVVTAVFGKTPIPKLEITLTRKSWPGGKLIAKGKTNPKGQVKLSGNWTNQEIVCAGGTYQRRPGSTFQAYVCQSPFPKAVRLEFK